MSVFKIRVIIFACAFHARHFLKTLESTYTTALSNSETHKDSLHSKCVMCKSPIRSICLHYVHYVHYVLANSIGGNMLARECASFVFVLSG